MKVFDALNGTLISEFMAYDDGFRGGVRVAGAIGGGSEILTAAGPGGGPHVKVFQGSTTTLVNSFMAYQESFRGGVSVSGLGIGDNGSSSLVTGAGSGGPSQVGVFASNAQQPILTFAALDPDQTPSSGFNATVSNDRVSPTVTITSPPSGQVGSNNITVQGIATDDKSGVRTVDAQVDGGAFVPVAFSASGNFSFTTSLALDGSATGQHTVTIRVKDKGGNTATASVGFTLDQAPIVSDPIDNVTVAQDAPPTVMDLKKHFSDPDSNDATGNTIVRFESNFGTIDIELFDDVAPLTVANFLNYVNSGRYSDSIFHRSVTDFVIQTGGFIFNEATNTLDAIDTDPPVKNEKNLPNTRGTIAMAKTSDPDSATSQFFINMKDNPSLDSVSNSGGFTVFGKVIGDGMAVADEIAAVSIENMGGTFSEIPLVDYTGVDFPNDAFRDNFVIFDSATVQPGGGGGAEGLNFSVVSNTNSNLVTAQIANGNLTLVYAAGQTGTAILTVQATDEFGLSVQTTFTVTVG